MPGYKLHGKPMLYFARFKEHYSLFAASGTFFAALEDELRGYELRKGTVRFPLSGWDISRNKAARCCVSCWWRQRK
jgi:uncharacterized protein YdhG (YjbR/CyaY superfamily)